MWPALFLSASLGLALGAADMLGTSALRGDALYHGKEPMNGRIRGHDDILPPETVRCANCHSAKSTSRLSAQPAPQLDSAFLLEMRRRRGGPPSSYDQRSFCRLLHTGGDPAYVLVAREMPIYDLTDEQCASLWTFLIRKDRTDAHP